MYEYDAVVNIFVFMYWYILFQIANKGQMYKHPPQISVFLPNPIKQQNFIFGELHYSYAFAPNKYLATPFLKNTYLIEILVHISNIKGSS